LAEQNRDYGGTNKPRGRPVNIVETAVSCLRRDIQSLKAQLSENLRHVRSLPAGKAVDSLVSDLLVHYQGLMVRALTEFLNDCYLRFLIEVINNGNRSKIKLLQGSSGNRVAEIMGSRPRRSAPTATGTPRNP
jgi:hypothetical protein